MHVKRTLIQGVHSISFSPDGKRLATASNDIGLAYDLKTTTGPPGEVKVWNVSSGTLESEFHGTSQVRALAFAPDSTTLVVGEAIGDIQLWNTVTNRSKKTINVREVYGRGISALAFSPNGKVLAIGGEDGSVKMLDHWE